MLQFAAEWLVPLVALLIIASCFSFATVPSGSMKPTLPVGSLLLSRFVDPEDLEYDDIVQFYPEDPGVDLPVRNGLRQAYISHVLHREIYVKRLIGKPGDVLEIKDGCVWRNGEELHPDYVMEPHFDTMEPYTVPDGTYFFMGDNRNDSYDCRYLGPIPEDQILSQCLFHLNPLPIGRS